MEWDSRKLELVSATLGVLMPEEWHLAARQIKARNASVRSWMVSSNSSSDPHIGWNPMCDHEANTVFVRNPFWGYSSVSVGGRLVHTEFIQIDADMAAKILVLGVVPA